MSENMNRGRPGTYTLVLNQEDAYTIVNLLRDCCDDCVELSDLLLDELRSQE